VLGLGTDGYEVDFEHNNPSVPGSMRMLSSKENRAARRGGPGWPQFQITWQRALIS
jgi:hypothetical protein